MKQPIPKPRKMWATIWGPTICRVYPTRAEARADASLWGYQIIPVTVTPDVVKEAGKK